MRPRLGRRSPSAQHTRPPTKSWTHRLGWPAAARRQLPQPGRLRGLWRHCCGRPP